LGLWEYWKTHTVGLRSRGVQPNAIATFLGLLFPVAAWLNALSLTSYPGSTLLNPDFEWTLGLGLAFLWETWLCWRVGIRPIAINLGVGLLGAFYVGWLFSFLIRLRLVEGTRLLLGYPVEQGAVLLFWLFITIWIGDTAAYFVGRAFGRRKLAPLLSPSKTVEGTIAHLLSSLVVRLVLANGLGFTLLQGGLIGVGVGILGQIGDLFKSAFKRALGIKDFGNLLPGHGGVLDRFDSLLFTAGWMWYVIR
ncbi:MAG: phosphatidate cytidylyltransferase, partial [candidate division WOR-3 bacterium]